MIKKTNVRRPRKTKQQARQGRTIGLTSMTEKDTEINAIASIIGTLQKQGMRPNIAAEARIIYLKAMKNANSVAKALRNRFGSEPINGDSVESYAKWISINATIGNISKSKLAEIINNSDSILAVYERVKK